MVMLGRAEAQHDRKLQCGLRARLLKDRVAYRDYWL